MERRLQPELMDAPGLDVAQHQAALRGLRRINAVSGVSRVLWNAIRRIAAKRGLSRFRVLDVACGGGDLVASLSRHARRSGASVRFAGCDISQVAVAQAKEASTDNSIDFFVTDAVNDPIPDGYDFVTSTLFLHHLDWPSSLRLLENMRQAAGQAVLVDDLIRCRTGRLLAWTGCRLLSRSPIVHYDGPVSVLGAYKVEEARRLAREAALDGARFIRHWPCRFLMEWERPR